MLLYRCDKCGCIRQSSAVVRIFWTPAPGDRQGDWDTEVLDLCDACADKLRIFLKEDGE